MTCLIGLSCDFPNWFIQIYDEYVVRKYKSIANSFTKLLPVCLAATVLNKEADLAASFE